MWVFVLGARVRRRECFVFNLSLMAVIGLSRGYSSPSSWALSWAAQSSGKWGYGEIPGVSVEAILEGKFAALRGCDRVYMRTKLIGP